MGFDMVLRGALRFDILVDSKKKRSPFERSHIHSGSTLVGTGPRKSPGPRPTDDFAQAGKLDGKEVLEAKAAAKVEVPIDEADLAQLPLMR